MKCKFDIMLNIVRIFTFKGRNIYSKHTITCNIFLFTVSLLLIKSLLIVFIEFKETSLELPRKMTKIIKDPRFNCECVVVSNSVCL